MGHKDISDYIDAARSLDTNECVEDMELMLRTIWEMLPPDYKERFHKTDEALCVLANSQPANQKQKTLEEEVAFLEGLFVGHSNGSPRFPMEDWQYEAGNGDTKLGYWNWVYNQYEMEGLDPSQDVAQSSTPHAP